MRTKVAVLGASGMLGSMLVDYLKHHFKVMPVSRHELDISPRMDLSTLDDIADSCDWIINAIGVIPQRSKDVEAMYFVNGLFPQILAHERVPVIHINTDCVFSGAKGFYTENDMSDCEDDYGKSKRLGEVRSWGVCNLRCSIIGLGVKDDYSLLGWFLNQPQGASIDAYTNHFWNGITTLHFAKICKAVIDGNLRIRFQHIIPNDMQCKAMMLDCFKRNFKRYDIKLSVKEHPQMINRTLDTYNKKGNLILWKLAGYPYPPTIEQMIKELAEYFNAKSRYRSRSGTLVS